MIEELGVEPVPAALQTVGWRDLFAINFTLFLNPVMYVVGALAVVQGKLPLPWAVLALVLGQALAYSVLVIVAQPGVDYGLPGQVALRGSLGYWGARLLSSPYRVVASTYWFAAQALTGALGIQALVLGLGGGRLPLVPVALALAACHSLLAVLGFDVTRYLLRAVLPASLALTGVLVGLFLTTSDRRFQPGRVFGGSHQHLTWVGFATYVTVMCGASLTLVTSVADFCRYTPTRRDMRIGYVASSLAAASITAFVGGYAGAATGLLNPFVAVADLTSSRFLLVLLLAAIVLQGLAANITNAYTAGLSLANTLPRLGRQRATVLAAGGAILLSAFPDFVNHAQRWITHLGNVAAPLAGVVVADYLVVNRGELDVNALFDRSGRYRGVNGAALVAVALGVAIYYAVPPESIKVLVGLVAGAALYLGLAVLRRPGLASNPSECQTNALDGAPRTSG